MRYKENKSVNEKKEYLDSFKNGEEVKYAKHEKALEKALDIRKFEIELYWKRGTYFWAFIAVAFTSYFLVLTMDVSKSGITQEFKDELIFILNLLGLFLSTSWFFVNKGSKYWQENWEKHVDLLEDDIMGPLYKTTVYRDGFWDRFNPLKSFPYSVGKINQLISFGIIFLWLFLLIRFIVVKLDFTIHCINISYTIVSAFFIVLFLVLFLYAKSSETNGKELNMKKREIE